MNFSIIIPVFKNEESLPELLDALNDMKDIIYDAYKTEVEIIFVVDGSPDRSFDVLREALPTMPFKSKLILHSRNFGSFAAIRTGLLAASGEYFGVMAADLQEPPELLAQSLGKLLSGECDVVVGCRQHRNDPIGVRVTSTIFWFLYKKFVMPDVPAKGVDVFACNRRFRDELLKLGESNSSLMSQIFWLGFRRGEIYYTRRSRKYGRSAWSFHKKVAYLLDSIFSFTDLPVQLLGVFGLMGVVLSVGLAALVILAKVIGKIEVPGYTATVLIVLFFGGVNSIGLSIVGNYACRAYENTKHRPLGVVMDSRTFGKGHCEDRPGN